MATSFSRCRRRFPAWLVLCGLLLALLPTMSSGRTAAAPLSGAYTDPSYFTSLPFGTHSHWYQPWRAYLETMPATTFLNGIGVNYDTGNIPNDQLAMRMLASHGVRHIRVEVGWGNLEYGTEQLNAGTASRLQSVLQAAKQHNIRVLILLNAHQGAPVPTLFFERTLAAAAQIGDTSVQLTDTSGLIVGYSGLSNLSDYWAAEAIITGINGNTVTLSKPMSKSFAAGTNVPMATLKYRPFSPHNSQEYADTVAGWKKYVSTLATFVEGTLGRDGSGRQKFDMEIWNELTFGSHFLYINDYYTINPYPYPGGTNQESIWGNLVKETAMHAEANANLFNGVKFGDGFANTIPWTASSTEPARIHAISKHPYAGRRYYNYDGKNDEQEGTALNALGQADPYVPSYTALFPEYYGTALQTETMVRDMGPITMDIYGTNHGRYARMVNGQVVPTPVWMTEIGFAPDEHGITDRATALYLKGKTTARYLAFFLNKGVEYVDMFSAAGGDHWLGIIQDNFLDYSRTNTSYPADDTSYTSPSLTVMSRMAARMSDGLDLNLMSTRPLSISALSDTHDHYQFAGDGSAAHRPLYNRDVFTFLPYQVNSSRFVIPYYVMSRDVLKVHDGSKTGGHQYDMPTEQYSVTVSGLNGNNATVSAYDPINNTNVPVNITGRTGNSLTLTVTATDYPYMLTVDEGSGSAGLRGEYYNTLNLNGTSALVRTDAPINFDWGSGSPGSGVSVDNFSVRWSGQLQATTNGNYTFATESDDGVRLWVNGQQLINNWTDHAPTIDTSGTISLTGGQKYSIRLEYYEKGGGAVIRLFWTLPGGSRVVIPQTALSV